jgi:hypothetical protein
MKWEDILKISAGERSDAERFADPEDLDMDDSEMRKVVLGYRKRLNSLMNRPKKIEETLQGRRSPVPVVDDFLMDEAKAIVGMNLDFLDDRLKRIENEMNRDSPNMYKLERMMEAYKKTFRNAYKPVRELKREQQYRQQQYIDQR